MKSDEKKKKETEKEKEKKKREKMGNGDFVGMRHEQDDHPSSSHAYASHSTFMTHPCILITLYFIFIFIF